MTSTQKRDPVKYTVLEKSLVGNQIYEAGETCEYDGLPADNLAPTCEEGTARAVEYVESNKERLAKMREQYAADVGMPDQAQFAKMFLEELAKANAQHAEQMAALQAGMAEAIAAAIAASATPGKPWAPKGKGKPENTETIA